MKLQMLYFCRYCIKLRDVIDKTCRNVLNILEFISEINIAIIFNKMILANTVVLRIIIIQKRIQK